MFGMRASIAVGTALAAACLAVSAGAASAASTDSTPGRPPNYTFADGTKGFALTTHGGPINPGVIVGFNPQPDPPGDGDRGVLIALRDPANPFVISPSTGGSFSFLIGLLMPGDGSVVPTPLAFPPDPIDGQTSFSGVIDDHLVQIDLSFGPGPVDPGSWVGFNPQPDPPGDVLKGSFAFGERVDPWMGFDIKIDGTALDFSLAGGAPEPATWGLMLLGFGGAGAALRARRRQRAPAA